MAQSSICVGRRPHKVKKEDRKPFVAPYSLSDFFSYPEKPSGNQLIDAISEAIVTHNYTTAKEIAEYLDLEPAKLNHAVQIFTGNTLGEVVSAFVFFRVEKYLKEHPDETLEQVAKATGYNSKSAVTCIYKRFGKGSPRANETKK